MITKMSITMPKTLEDFTRWRVRNGGYTSISDYLRELVRNDQRFYMAKHEQLETTTPIREPLASAARRDRLGHR